MADFGAFSLTQIDAAPDLPISEAGTVVCDTLTDLDGMSGLTLLGRWSYGSGSGSVLAFAQTSFDQGASWCDVACFSFGALSGALLFNLSAGTPVVDPVQPGDAALADNTAVDGLLGDRLRLKVIVTGAFGSSSVLVVRAVVR